MSSLFENKNQEDNIHGRQSHWKKTYIVGHQQNMLCNICSTCPVEHKTIFENFENLEAGLHGRRSHWKLLEIIKTCFVTFLGLIKVDPNESVTHQDEIF